jgi:hypothetical protein
VSCFINKKKIFFFFFLGKKRGGDWRGRQIVRNVVDVSLLSHVVFCRSRTVDVGNEFCTRP